MDRLATYMSQFRHLVHAAKIGGTWGDLFVPVYTAVCNLAIALDLSKRDVTFPTGVSISKQLLDTHSTNLVDFRKIVDANLNGGAVYTSSDDSISRRYETSLTAIVP
jgi:hypothetical protein